MEKTFTFDMASKAYADYILNRKDRYAPLIVEIPEGIEDIEPLAFDMMPVTSVKFPSTMTEISKGAFGESTLEKLEIPGNIKKICGSAFSEIFGMKELILHEGVEEIGSQAFFMCHNLETPIVIPKSVKKIGTDAFWGLYGSPVLKFEGDPNDVEFESEENRKEYLSEGDD